MATGYTEARPRRTSLAHSVHRRLGRHRRLVAGLLLGLSVFCGLLAVRPPAEPTTPVVVVTAALSSGDVMTQADLRVAEYPPELVPEGATEALEEAIGTRVALPMVPGEVVTPARLLTADALSHWSEMQPPSRSGYPRPSWISSAPATGWTCC